jgi:hypothetical protein
MYVWGDPEVTVMQQWVGTWCVHQAGTGSFTGAKHLWITSIYELGCCYVNNVSHRVFGQP